MRQTVLVTGGAGYIGSHTCKALDEAGYLPITLDDLSVGNLGAVQWGPIVKAKVTNQSDLQEIHQTFAPIGVIHCAAFTDVAESVRDPMKYYNGILNEVAIKHEFSDLPIVFSSSAAVYGSNAGKRQEDDKLTPISPYGKMKVAGEKVLSKAMRLRYFNVAGADKNVPAQLRTGTLLIPKLLAAIKADEIFTIQGDGSAVRDFIHVSDVAAANVAALQELLDGKPGAAINICSGIGYSVNEIVAAAGATKVEHGEARQGDLQQLTGSNGLAEEILQWRPTRTLYEMIWSQ